MKQLLYNLFTTLAESINWVDVNKHKGCICPCCGQIAKVYKRKLNSGMAMELIRLYKFKSDEYIHHTQFASVQGGEISKLSYWGLVEDKLNNNTNTRCSGLWAITNTGRLFVENKIRIPKHIYLYDSKFLSFSEETINIIDSLGSRFSYYELMNN